MPAGMSPLPPTVFNVINRRKSIRTNPSKISNSECKNIHFFKCFVLGTFLTKTEEITSDPYPFKCILDLYIDYRANPPDQTTSLRSVPRHHTVFVRVRAYCTGMSLGFFNRHADVRRDFIFTGGYGSCHYPLAQLGWGSLYPVAGAEDRHQPGYKRDGLLSEPISFWASFGLQFVNVKIIL